MLTRNITATKQFEQPEHLGACLVALLRASLAHGMQFKAVWFPGVVHGPGRRDAAKAPEPGSLKTDFDSVFAEPGWRGHRACMRVRRSMHETGGEQANQSSEAACGRLHSTQTKQARLHATSLVRGRLAPRCRSGCLEMRTKRALIATITTIH